MFEGTAAQDAGEAFKKKIGEPVKVLSLEIERDVATLRAQDPKNPQNVDEYKYVKGFVAGPTPVRLNSLESISDGTLFDLNLIDLGATEALAKAAMERTKVEGGKVRKMTIERGLQIASNVSKSGNVRWTVEVEGPRESATATANSKGQIVGLDLSQTARAASYSAFSPEVLRDAGPAIKEAFGDKVKLFELNINDKYIWFKALTPGSSTEVTQYKYDINGVTTSQLSNLTDNTPIKVRMSRKNKLEDFLFDLDAVNLQTAPELGKRALSRLGFTTGKVEQYKISREARDFWKGDLETRWDVSCRQGRKTGSVTFDLSGKELEVSNQ